MNQKSKNKEKIIFSIILSGLIIFCFYPFKKIQAGTWGEALAAANWELAMQQAWKKFDQAMTASLKQQAVKLLTDRIEVLLTGNSRKSLIITDYEDYVFGTAKKQGLLFTNHFFRSATSGVSASTRKYLKATENAIKKDTEMAIDSVMPDIDKRIQGGADNLFDVKKGGGDPTAAVVKSMNNPYGAWMEATDLRIKEMMKVIDGQKAKYSAGRGFDSGTNAPKSNSYTDSQGRQYTGSADDEYNYKKGSGSELINLPGSIVADMTAKINLLPFEMVAAAENIPAVVATLAAQTLSKVIEKGIADVTQPIDETLAGVNRYVSGGINEVRRDIYQGIKFSGSSGN